MNIVKTKVSKAGVLDRQILMAFITSEHFIREAAPMYSPEFLGSDFARAIAGWCIKYHEKYKQAPGKYIQTIYEKEKEKHGKQQEELYVLIAKFLGSISKEFDAGNLNIEFLLDEAERWWQQRDYEELSDDIKDALEQAGPEEAAKILDEHLPIRRKTRKAFCPFKDKERVREAMASRALPIMRFKGALGELLNPYLVRDSLIGIMGPEKRGKTFWLTEFAFRACMNRLNVVMFQTGDMTEPQIINRLFSRVLQRPTEERRAGRRVVASLDCMLNQLDECDLNKCPAKGIMIRTSRTCPVDVEEVPPNYRPCSKCRNLDGFEPAICYQYKDIKQATPADIEKGMDKMARHMRTKEFRIYCDPNYSKTVRDIDNDLQAECENGFIPDVVVIDYADILAPERSGMEARASENERWARLRKLSQDYHCLVIVATQTNKDSYSRDTVTRKNFSEDKRKLAHVVGMLGLHQTEEEKAQHIMRLSWVLHRECELSVQDQVVCIQNLTQGNPHEDSFWRPKEMPQQEKSEKSEED